MSMLMVQTFFYSITMLVVQTAAIQLIPHVGFTGYCYLVHPHTHGTSPC